MMDGVVSDSGAPSRASKRMKKRKQLDALVPDKKIRKKCPSSSKLIADSESSDLEGYRVVGRRANIRSLLSAFVPICGVLLMLSCILSVGLLTWMGMGMREQMDEFRARLRHVELGNQAVPTELHDYHTQLQNLQKNQSELSSQQTDISHHIQQLTHQMGVMQKGLKTLEEDLKKGPELLSIPGKMEDLQKSIASFGSKLKDFGNTLRTVKDKEASLQDQSNNLTLTINNMKHDVEDIKEVSNSDQLATLITWLGENVTSLQHNFSSVLPKILDENKEQYDQLRMVEGSYANLTIELDTVKEHLDTQIDDLLSKIENLQVTETATEPELLVSPSTDAQP